MYRIIYALLVIIISGCSINEDCSKVYNLEVSGRYERHMKVAKAWALCPTDSQENEKYRFVWLRSSHNTIVVDLIKAHGRIDTTATRLDGTGASGPGNITEMRTVVWTQEELDQFKGLIEKMDFWNLEGSRDASRAKSQWILEGAIHDKAHAVDRSGDIDGPFREAALLLLEKSQIDLNGEVY